MKFKHTRNFINPKLQMHINTESHLKFLHWCNILPCKLVLHIFCAFVKIYFSMPDLQISLELSTCYAASSILTRKSTRKPENKIWINKQFCTGERLGFELNISLILSCSMMIQEETKTRSSSDKLNVFRGFIFKKMSF